VAIGMLLMLYNVVRFGSPVEFGQKYQLAAYDPATRDGNKLAYVPPGMWYYLFSTPQLALGFPFIRLPWAPASYPFTAPTQYNAVEVVGGLLPTAPFVVFALAAPAVLRGTARRVALGLVAIGFLIIVTVSFAIWGATMRYEVDFASVLLIAAALGWVGWTAQLSGLRRRLLAGGGVLLIAWGVVCGAAFGVTGYFDGLRTSSPKTFARLQNLTSLIPTVVSYLDGEPKTLDDYSAPDVTGATARAGSVTFALSTVPMVLTVASGSPRRYGLKLRAAPAKPPPRGTIVAIRMPDTGNALQIPATIGPTILPISLHRGLNRIEFRVARPAGAVTRLTDVRIVPLPSRAP
jgi:hypothetical protein